MPSTSTHTSMACSGHNDTDFNQIYGGDGSLGHNINAYLCYHMLPNRITYEYN